MADKTNGKNDSTNNDSDRQENRQQYKQQNIQQDTEVDITITAEDERMETESQHLDTESINTEKDTDSQRLMDTSFESDAAFSEALSEIDKNKEEELLRDPESDSKERPDSKEKPDRKASLRKKTEQDYRQLAGKGRKGTKSEQEKKKGTTPQSQTEKAKDKQRNKQDETQTARKTPQTAPIHGMTPSETHNELQTQLKMRIDNLTSMNKHLDEENRNLQKTVNELVDQLRNTQQQQQKKDKDKEEYEETTRIMREEIQGLRETNEIQRRRTEEETNVLRECNEQQRQTIEELRKDLEETIERQNKKTDEDEVRKLEAICIAYQEQMNNYREIADQTNELNRELHLRVQMLEKTIARTRQQGKDTATPEPMEVTGTTITIPVPKHDDRKKDTQEKADSAEKRRVIKTWTAIAKENTDDTSDSSDNGWTKPKKRNKDTKRDRPSGNKDRPSDNSRERDRSRSRNRDRDTNRERQRKERDSNREESRDRIKKKKTNRDKLKIALIGDSNMDRIIHYMKEDRNREWIHIRRTRTVEGLWDMIEDKEIIRTLFECDQTIIMLGTNDIRRGGKAERIEASLQDAAKELTKRTLTYTRTMTVPPMILDDDRTREQVNLNRLIRANAKRPIIIRCFDNTDIRKQLDRDGYHISHSAAHLLAQEIQDNAITTEDHTKEQRIVMPIKTRDIPHIIGKKGKTVIDLRKTYNAKLNVANEEIFMKGEQVDNLKDEIETILRSIEQYRGGRSQSSTYTDSD